MEQAINEKKNILIAYTVLLSASLNIRWSRLLWLKSALMNAYHQTNINP